MVTCANSAFAAGTVTVTKATGGSAISADTAGSIWTSLSGPTIAESAAGTIGTGTIILHAPSGFVFNSANPVTATVSKVSGPNGTRLTLTSSAATVTTSTITISVASKSSSEIDQITWSGIQVRPTAGTPLASGNISETGTSSFAYTSGSSASNYGTLTEVGGAATQLLITQQPSATATAGTVFAQQPSLSIQDQFGNGATASSVTATETSGGNLNATTTAQTAAFSGGVANFSGLFVTNAASSVTLTFTVASLTTTSSAINVSPASPSKLAVTTQPSPTATAATAFVTQPQVTVEDAYGNLLSVDGTTITAAETSGGNLNATTLAQATTTSAGVATFSGLYVTNAGTVTLTFTASGLNAATSSGIAVSPLAANALTVETASNGSGSVVPSQNITSGNSITVYAIARDIYGNFVSNPSSTWSLIGITGGVTTSDLTPGSGASATFTGHLVGSAQINGVNGAFSANSGILTVSAGAASKLLITTQPSSTATAGQAFAVQPVVTVQDANGNTVTSYSTAVTARETAGGNLDATTTAQTATPSSGVATFSGLFVTNAATVTLTFTSGTLTSVVSAGINVAAATPAKLVFTTAPLTLSAGTASGTITVQRQDQYGNPNTTETTRTVTLSSSSTGTVTFNPTSLSIATGASSASFTYTDTKAGTPTITAASTSPTSVTSATQLETVNKAFTTTSVTSSSPSSVFGQAAVFTATVTGTNGITPTGTVTFKDASTTLGTATLDGSAQATFTNSSLTVGSHSITTVYGGDGTFNGSTSPVLTQTVSKASTAVALTSTLNPACAGQSIGFTATVTVVAPGAGTPSGTVTFKDGTTSLATITLSSGVATFNTSTLSTGPRSITAVYNGSTSFNTNTSAVLTETVNPLPTATVSGTSVICLGNSTNIQAALTGTGPWAVTWSDGVIQNNVLTSPALRSVSPASTTTYTVTSVSDSNCSNSGSGSATVTVNIPPSITSQPPNSMTLCAGSPAVFSVTATGSSLTYQWLKNGTNLANGGNISGATTATLTINPSTTSDLGSYSVRVSGFCAPSVTSRMASLTVNPTPNATIAAAADVCGNTPNNVASVADAGPGASYGWSISGGTITSGANTANITYTAGASGTITLRANVTNSIGCWASSTSSVIIPIPSRTIEAWKNSAPLLWQSSTFNKGDAYYSDGTTVPLRFILTNMCPGGSWSINIAYDFKDANSAGHFYDFLTTYNTSEQSELGSECAGHVCGGSPTTFPIPLDPQLSYEVPGVFTVYNGTITNVSPVTATNFNSSTIQKQFTLSGVTAPGGSSQDVLILLGGHFASEIQWGPGNGASSWSGASGKVYVQFLGDSSLASLAINPATIAQLGDLAVNTMTATPGPVCAGSTIAYSLMITNSGPDQAQSVTVQDNLPAGATLVSATLSQGTVTGTTNLTFTLGNIDAATNASISMVVSLDPTVPAGTLVNSASVSANSPTDPNFNNNTLSASTIVYGRTTTSPLANQVGCLGISTGFGTVAAGTGPFTYQWTKNGTNLTGATAASFTITSVSSSDAGTYCVVVTGACNSVTNCATLTVSTNASTSPLVNLTKCPGETAVFSTTPSGTGPFTIDWKKNGVIIPGQTGTTLTLTNVSSADEAVYCVEVAGFCNATNNCATLTVNSPVQVVTAPASQAACAGSNATFSVNATGSSLTFQWYAGTNLLVGQTASSLTITNVSATNLTSYTVIVSGACGNPATNTASLTVTLPVITAPVDVTLACTNSFDPNVTPALGVATVTDSCSTTTPTYSDQVIPGNCAGNYTIKRTWTSQDGFGNTSTAVQTITVQDTAPVVIAPPDLVVAYTADISTNSTGVATVQAGCGPVSLGYSDVVTAQPDGSEIISRTWVGTDNCGNSGSALQTITLDNPLALILPSQSDVSATDLVTLTVTNTATDPNGSSDTLSYQLLNPPAGVTIDSNGVISWTPTLGQSPSTNIITTVVTTTVVNSVGSTTISTTNSFVVIVTGPYDGLNMLVDSDGDGLTNLVEYAVGGDPLNSADGNNDIIIYLTQAGTNHYLAMKYKARLNATALQLQYLPEVSADKVAWFSDANHVLGLSVAPLDSVFNWVTVRDTTPITPSEARFIRLHVIWATMESFSPIWIGTDTLLQGNNLTLFSQRMVRPILGAGTISSISSATLSDTNATFTAGQFGTNGLPSYVELNDGAIMDIANTAPQSVALTSSAAGLASAGDPYRLRAHFTVASLLGTNNETGLVAGANPAQADNVLIYMPESQRILTVFYYSNPSFTSFQGWVRADTFTPSPDLVVYPEEGMMVRRIVPSDAHMYLCGPIKLGVTLAPVLPGYNLLGTLKSLTSMPLSTLNLYTGDSTTGMVSGLNPSQADNLIVVQPDGTVTTYFFYDRPTVFQGWINANGFTFADDVLIPPGSAFFINRQSPGAFTWTIPAE